MQIIIDIGIYFVNFHTMKHNTLSWAPKTSAESRSGFSSLRTRLLILLTATGITTYAVSDSLDTHNGSYEPTNSSISLDALSSYEIADENTFVVPEHYEGNINRDSLNKIVESELDIVKKQLEAEFLQKKFKEFQGVVIDSLNAFKKNEIFPQKKNEGLSDDQIAEFIVKAKKAKDLPWLASVCEYVNAYIDRLLNKQEVSISGKTLKTKNMKDPDYFIRLNEYKDVFQTLGTSIKETKFQPNVFENIQANETVTSYSTTLDSLQKELKTWQDSLNVLQDRFIKLSKEVSDSTDKKIQDELALESGKIDYTEFQNAPVISDSNKLDEKHAIELAENALKNRIKNLETFINTTNASIIAIENSDIPSVKGTIESLYQRYFSTMELFIQAVREQYTGVMQEKNKDILSGIKAFELEKIQTSGDIDSLMLEHKKVADAITMEKDKVKNDSIENLLRFYQREENIVSQKIEWKNEELIQENITLGFKFQESYDIYTQMLNKCRVQLVTSLDNIQKQITSIHNDLQKMTKKMQDNDKIIEKLSASADINDVNESQKKVKENQVFIKKIAEAKKNEWEKQTLADKIQNEISDIDKVKQYIENNKNLVRFAMKIYLATKKIQTNQAKLTAAQETENIYKNMYERKLVDLNKTTLTLDVTDKKIHNLMSIDTNEYDVISDLLEAKDSLLLYKMALEGDVQNLEGKIIAKQREIDNLLTAIDQRTAFFAENLDKRNGLIYDRQQSFKVDNSPYYQKELIRTPEELLKNEDLDAIDAIIKKSK